MSSLDYFVCGTSLGGTSFISSSRCTFWYDDELKLLREVEEPNSDKNDFLNIQWVIVSNCLVENMFFLYHIMYLCDFLWYFYKFNDHSFVRWSQNVIYMRYLNYRCIIKEVIIILWRKAFTIYNTINT